MKCDLSVRHVKLYIIIGEDYYINLCFNLRRANISTLLKTIQSFTRFVINKKLSDGMQIEGVKLEAVIFSVHSSAPEAHTHILVASVSAY